LSYGDFVAFGIGIGIGGGNDVEKGEEKVEEMEGWRRLGRLSRVVVEYLVELMVECLVECLVELMVLMLGWGTQGRTMMMTIRS
jgi:hypothetical protein